MRPRLFITLVGFGAALVAADARAQTPDDPYEGMNRRFYASAMRVDERYFLPLVQALSRADARPDRHGASTT